MKTILLFLSVFFSTAIYSQGIKALECQIDYISPTMLKQVAKYDRETFEMYAMKKGYSYYDAQITDKINSLMFKRNEWGEGSEFLSHNTKYPTATLATYETSRVCLLPNWYRDLKSFGWILNETREWEGAYVKVYT